MLEERNVSKYWFRFAERYDEYKALVEACENEYEFFAVMNGLLNEVPGCHTQLLWPDYVDNAPNIFYGSFNFAAYQYPDERMYEAANVMNNKISEFVSDKYDMKIMTFNYIDGIYELNRRGGTTMDIPDGYCRIELINGNEPADYISEELFSQKLKYDKMNQSLYRDLIIFNDTYGNKCTLTLKYDNGETYEVEVYGGVKGEIASIYALSNSLSETEENASSNEQGEEKSNDYLITENEFIGDYTYSYLDGNTLYTNHYTFDSGIDEKKAYAEFIKACDYDNVIIDIRDNTGG